MRRLTLPIVFLCIALPAAASARSHRVPQLPYGNTFGCTSCHVSAGGGGDFTEFGSDAILALVGPDLLQERDLEWSLVYQIDSDRDGFTNGEEVNDPSGLWRIGDANPIGGRVTNPGDPNSHPPQLCGDGRVTPPEECDGANHRDFTCIGLGLDEGALSCLPSCIFDRSECGDGPPRQGDDPGTVSTPDDSESDDDPTCATSTSTRFLSVWNVAIVAAIVVASRRRS